MHSFYHPISIPGLTIPGNIFLAPLAGFTDRAFRSVCVEEGAAFTYTEMVSAEALVRESGKTRDLLKPAGNETVYAVQLFASTPLQAARAAGMALEFRPALIDLNCGCPVPKIVKSGAGSSLLREPMLLGEIVQAIAEAVPVPVSVKIRSGWDASSLNYLETAGAAVRGGARIIGFHPRTKSQGYGGRANREHLKLLKEAFPDIPVIGTGDLFTARDAYSMMETTGCDGVMFARGALGNPFIFESTKELFLTGIPGTPPTVEKRLSTAWLHFMRLVEDKGERTAAKEMRKHFCSYTRGIPGGATVRNRIVHAETVAEYRSILDDFSGSPGSVEG